MPRYVPSLPSKKGSYLLENNIWVKRPGTGEIIAEKYKDLLGKRATTNLESDVQLRKSDYE